LCR
jgi:hypothetical protein